MIFFGQRFYGRLRAGAGLSVETMFFHLMWIPLIPYRGLITIDGAQSIKSRFRLKSVLLGYCQGWGPFFTIVGIAGLFSDSPAGAFIVIPIGLATTALGWAPKMRQLDYTATDDVRHEFHRAAGSQAHPPAQTPAHANPPAHVNPDAR